MITRIARRFALMALAGIALWAPAARGDESVDYWLTMPRYYKDGVLITLDTRREGYKPEFVSGAVNRAFTVFKDALFPTSSSYACNNQMPEGYYASSWSLEKAWGTTTSAAVIETWPEANGIVVVFDYEWAAKYGKQLELVVSIDQMNYTVTCDANGGEWTDGKKPNDFVGIYKTSGVAPPASCVTYDKYSFVEWNTASDGSGISVEAEGVFSGSSLNITENRQTVTLYAQWEIRRCTVELDGNGGTVEPQSKSVVWGHVLGDLPTPKKGQYAFLGWYDAASGGNRYDGDSVVRSDLKLFAHWGEAPVTETVGVTVSPEAGGIVQGCGTYYLGEKITLKAVANYGYAFKGWNDGVTQVERTFTAGDGKTLPTAATFTPEKRWVEFEGELHSGEAEVRAYDFGDRYDRYRKLPEPIKPSEQSVFVGWFDAEEGGYRYVDTNIVNFTAATQTLYACWTERAEVKYAISYVLSDGAAIDGEYPTNYVSSIGMTLPARVLREDYDFAGWFADKSLKGERQYAIAAGSTGSRTFYPAWSNLTFAVSYAPGDFSSGTTITSNFNHGVTICLPGESKFARTGYTQDGWSLRTDGRTLDAELGAPYDANRSATFYPHWAANRYAIAFEANGGEGEMPPMEGAYGERVMLSANAFGKTGSQFDGWATVESGGKVRYDECAVVSNLTDEVDATVTLYAVWSEVQAAKTYGIVFDPGAVAYGSVAPMSDLASGEAVKLPECTYTNLASVGFVGWVYNSVTNVVGEKGFWHEPKVDGEVIVLTAAWEDVGNLSKCVGADNIALANGELASSAQWNTRTDGSIYCKFNKKNLSHLITQLIGPGTISFEYAQAVKAFSGGNFGIYCEDAQVLGIPFRDHAVGEYVVGKADFAEDGERTIEWRASDMPKATDPELRLRNIRWQPAHTNVVTFLTNGVVLCEKKAYNGSVVPRPTGVVQPTERAGYNLVWRKVVGEVVTDETYDFNSPVAADMTLAADWVSPKRQSITVVVTGAVYRVTYDGSEHSAAGWGMASYYPKREGVAFAATDIGFEGEARASGTEPGGYPMGLKAEQFANRNAAFDVFFTVVDGGLEIVPAVIPAAPESFAVTNEYNRAEQSFDAARICDAFVGAGYAVTNVAFATSAEDPWTSLSPILTDVGSVEFLYRVLATGCEPFVGVAALTIVPREMGGVTVGEIAAQRETGVELRPEISLTYGGEVLTEGVDYFVEYFDNVSVGTGRAVISGIGNFGGTVVKTFEITPIPSPPSVEPRDIPVTVEIAGEQLIEVYDGRVHTASNWVWRASDSRLAAGDFRCRVDTTVSRINGGESARGLKPDSFEGLDGRFKISFVIRQDVKITIQGSPAGFIFLLAQLLPGGGANGI